MTRTPIPNCPQEDKPIRDRAWTDEQIKTQLLDAWRAIGHVSGSALLAGEKKAQTPEQRGLVYRDACSALIDLGNAYHDLTGKHPTCEPEHIGATS